MEKRNPNINEENPSELYMTRIFRKIPLSKYCPDLHIDELKNLLDTDPDFTIEDLRTILIDPEQAGYPSDEDDKRYKRDNDGNMIFFDYNKDIEWLKARINHYDFDIDGLRQMYQDYEVRISKEEAREPPLTAERIAELDARFNENYSRIARWRR